MKYLLAFSSFIFLFSIQGYTQDLPSFEYKGSFKVGIPPEDYKFSLELPKIDEISLDNPFNKADLVKTPVYYSKQPSEMGVLFKRNPKPEKEFTIRIQQLPEIGSKMPIQDFPQDKNYTLLIKEYN